MTRTTIGALVAVAAVYSVDLFLARPIMEKSEARYAEVAREMFVSGDYVVPHLHGLPHPTKPPATYWLTAAGYHLLGVHEAGARVMAVVAGVLFIALAVPLTRRIFPRDGPPAWLTVFFTAATPLVVVLAHLVTTDIFVSLMMNATLVLFWMGYTRPEARRRYAYALWVLWAAGLLTKGPVAVLVPVLVMCVFTWWQGRVRDMRWICRWPAVVVVAAAGIPWLMAVEHQVDGLIAYLMRHEIFDRVFTESNRRGGAVWYYIPVIAGGMFPWAWALPAAWRRYARRCVDTVDAEGLAGLRFLWIWIAVPFVFFSLIGSKLPAYILLVALPIALLSAWWFTHIVRETDIRDPWDALFERALWGALALLIIGSGVALAMGDTLAPWAVLRGPLPVLVLIAAVVAFVAHALLHARPSLVGRAAAVLAPLGIVGVAGEIVLLGISNDYLSVRSLAHVVATRRAHGDFIASYETHPAGWDFYLDTPSRLIKTGPSGWIVQGHPLRPLRGDTHIARWLNGRSAWVIVKPHDVDNLARYAPHMTEVARTPRFVVVRTGPESISSGQ